MSKSAAEMASLMDKQAAECRAMLDPGGDGEPPRLKGDTAIARMLDMAHSRERDAERYRRLAALEAESDAAVVARLQSDIAAGDGSHGPAQQWLRMATDLQEKRAAAEEARRLAAEQGEDPAAVVREMFEGLRQLIQEVPAIRPWAAEIARLAIAEGQDVSAIELPAPPLRVA